MTFHSSTDIQTLHEQGGLMPHYLSLVVNNAGNRNCRITRQVKTSKMYTVDFGGDIKPLGNGVLMNVESVEMEVVDIIEKRSYQDEVEERINVLMAEKQKNDANKVAYDNLVSDSDFDEDSLFPDAVEQTIGTTEEVDKVAEFVLARMFSASFSPNEDKTLEELFDEADAVWSKCISNKSVLYDIQCNMLEDLLTVAVNMSGMNIYNIAHSIVSRLDEFNSDSVIVGNIVNYIETVYD